MHQYFNNNLILYCHIILLYTFFQKKVFSTAVFFFRQLCYKIFYLLPAKVHFSPQRYITCGILIPVKQSSRNVWKKRRTYLPWCKYTKIMYRTRHKGPSSTLKSKQTCVLLYSLYPYSVHPLSSLHFTS